MMQQMAPPPVPGQMPIPEGQPPIPPQQ
jgi:hypothetical protein